MISRGRTIMAITAGGMVLTPVPVNAIGEVEGLTIHLSVPVMCALKHDPDVASVGDNSYSLGQLEEYCNAPRGYQITVNYQPGSLRGAKIKLGSEMVILDGSGITTVSRESGPRIQERQITATPGPRGFDTDRLSFNIAAV